MKGRLLSSISILLLGVTALSGASVPVIRLPPLPPTPPDLARRAHEEISARNRGSARSSTTSVWKVTSPAGGVMYLGGSIHRLERNDFPLPPAFDRAFDRSDRLAFEIAPSSVSALSLRLRRTGFYPPGDNLSRHLSARTYAQVVELFNRAGIPKSKLNRFRPWFAVYLCLSAEGSSDGPGVEAHFGERARVARRTVEGIESAEEAARPFAALTDRHSEQLLGLGFSPEVTKSRRDLAAIKRAWRDGDVEVAANTFRAAYGEFPAIGDGMIANRNRAWLPRLKTFLESGKTYYVLAGIAHLGGRDGLLALLRGQGCRIEQM